jgi:hypothetical protein
MGNLNGQTTKGDFIALVEGRGFTVNRGGLRTVWDCIAKCTWVMYQNFLEADKRLP